MLIPGPPLNQSRCNCRLSLRLTPGLRARTPGTEPEEPQGQTRRRRGEPAPKRDTVLSLRLHRASVIRGINAAAAAASQARPGPGRAACLRHGDRHRDLLTSIRGPTRRWLPRPYTQRPSCRCRPEPARPAAARDLCRRAQAASRHSGIRRPLQGVRGWPRPRGGEAGAMPSDPARQRGVGGYRSADPSACHVSRGT